MRLILRRWLCEHKFLESHDRMKTGRRRRRNTGQAGENLVVLKQPSIPGNQRATISQISHLGQSAERQSGYHAAH
jgi:hypothetical protein